MVASKILAEAAFIEGKEVSAFPYFGVERRGAPVTAFTRIQDLPVRVKSQIYDPDYVIVLDQVLIKAVDVAAGLKEDGFVLVNSRLSGAELGLARARTIDATDIAIRYHLGSSTAPIVNSTILGAFARSSGLVSLDSLMQAVRNNVPGMIEENVAAAKDAWNIMEVS